MKLQKMPRRQKLSLDGLMVDTFPTLPEIEVPQMGALTVNITCTRCPSHIDSECPCCSGPELCG